MVKEGQQRQSCPRTLKLSIRRCLRNVSKNDMVKRLIKELKMIIYENMPRIKEFNISYLFGDYMFCLGVTHVNRRKNLFFDEKDLFPYALLLKEAKRPLKNQILSRSMAHKKRLRIYNAVEMDKENLFQIHEDLYLIMYLFPESVCSLESTQIRIDFLVKSLQNSQSKKMELLYCVNFPRTIS